MSVTVSKTWNLQAKIMYRLNLRRRIKRHESKYISILNYPKISWSSQKLVNFHSKLYCEIRKFLGTSLSTSFLTHHQLLFCVLSWGKYCRLHKNMTQYEGANNKKGSICKGRLTDGDVDRWVKKRVISSPISLHSNCAKWHFTVKSIDNDEILIIQRWRHCTTRSENNYFPSLHRLKASPLSTRLRCPSYFTACNPRFATVKSLIRIWLDVRKVFQGKISQLSLVFSTSTVMRENWAWKLCGKCSRVFELSHEGELTLQNLWW